MRNIILLSILAGAGLALVAYFVWLVIRALYEVYRSWRLGQELVALQSEVTDWRTRRATANQERLNTGCKHQFEDGPGALYRRVCRHCGLEAERTSEECDHRWRQLASPIPRSTCDACGQEIEGALGIPHSHDLAAADLNNAANPKEA
ncbi:MAG: hypothetical protein VX346_04265 [Planctomycetota bacterium]|nr:hypothetical protein [Planctomycetota bacterium]